MKQLRRVVFYFLLAVYVILCPLTILYALGYFYKPGLELGIIRTGLIYLSTAPPGASVYFGNKRFRRKTPAVIPHLPPGDYAVKVLLKNHKPWARTIPVEAEKATVMERILLLPEQWKIEPLSRESFDRLLPLPGSRFFLLQRGPRAADLFVYDWKEESYGPLLPRRSIFRDAAILSYFSMPESPTLLLKVNFRGSEKYLWIDFRRKKRRIEDLTVLFPETPHHIEWDGQAKHLIFSSQNGIVSRLDLISKSLDRFFAEAIRGYGLSHGQIYLLKKEPLFLRMDLNGENREPLLKDPALIQSLFGEKPFRIEVLSKDLIVFLGEEGELLANRLPYRFVEGGVKGLEFQPEEERLLFWTGHEIGVLDFSEAEEDEEIFERGPRRVWVFREGKKIEQAFWVYEGSHVLFRDENEVFLLELETYEKPHVHSLLEVKKGSSVFYSEAAGKLYYLENAAARLASLELLPRREILPLTFPQLREERKRMELVEG